MTIERMINIIMIRGCVTFRSGNFLLWNIPVSVYPCRSVRVCVCKFASLSAPLRFFPNVQMPYVTLKMIQSGTKFFTFPIFDETVLDFFANLLFISVICDVGTRE